MSGLGFAPRMRTNASSTCAAISGNKYRGTLDAPLTQVGERGIGLDQRIARHGGLDPGPWRNRKELVRILAREVCDRHDLPLLPEIAIGKARNVGHVNAAADHATALPHRLERKWHQRADRSEDDGSIERLRGHLLRAAGPDRTERLREALCRHVPRPRKGIDAAALPGRDLRQDVGGSTETIEPKRAPLARHTEA